MPEFFAFQTICLKLPQAKRNFDSAAFEFTIQTFALLFQIHFVAIEMILNRRLIAVIVIIKGNVKIQITAF